MKSAVLACLICGIISFSASHQDRTAAPQEKFPFSVHYLKIVKTGSTTMTNIFSRIALKHKLLVASVKKHPSRVRESRKFVPFLTPTFEKGKSKKYNIFMHRAAYVPGKVEQFLEAPVKHVAVIRNPLKWMDSNLNFFPRYRHLDLGKNKAITLIGQLKNEIWKTKNKKTLKHCHNPFSKSFGMQPDDPDKMNTLRKLDDQFLVLINDYWAESLILMRRILKLDFSDVLYSTLRLANYKHKPLNETLYKELCEWNSDDCLLYEFFNKTFWRKIHQQKNILSEVAHYKSVFKDINEFCSPVFVAISSEKSVDISAKIEIPSSDWHDSFVFSKMDCLLTRIAPRIYRPLFHYVQNPGAPCQDKCILLDRGHMCKEFCHYTNSTAINILKKFITWKSIYMWH